MDSQTTTPAVPDPLTVTLNNVTIDNAERKEFSNTARDMFKSVLNYNQNNRSAVGAGQVVEDQMPKSHDAINYLLNAAPLFLEEVRKNDQSRSRVVEQTGKDSGDPVPQAVTADHTPHSSILEDPIDIIDMAPSDPSSLPISSIADRYTRSILECLRGYPLYNPKPFSELSEEYLRNGVNVGDVGFVRGTGIFDFLFNICPSQTGFINPPNLPDGFCLETPEYSVTTRLEPLPPNTCLFQSPVTKTRSGEYICEGSEGAVLELPRGAIRDEAINTRPFERLAARHGVQWYEYTMNRGRGISNGSLYLITSVAKCAQWGIAVFDRPCAPGQGLRFDKKRSLLFGKSTSKYHWKGSHTFHTKASNPDQGDVANQCVFVRGYKIMIRQDIFDNLCNDQPRRSDSAIPSSSPQAGSSSMTQQHATGIMGDGGPDPVSRLTSAGPFSPITMTKSDEEVVLHPNFNSSLVHPADFINAALLSQNPGAKVALTHDDVWCNLLRNNFPKLNNATLMNIARSYTNTVDEYDCVSLEKVSDPSNILEESSHPLQGTESPTLQGHLTSFDGDYSPVPAITFLTLPRELVERILLLLDTKSMLKCRLVNREFNAIIQSSTLVQYCLACEAAGVTDNPQSPLSYAERLEALKEREATWKNLKPVFETIIKVNDQPSTFYELTAGNYFLTDNDRKNLYYCHLPSSPQENPQWFRIPGHGPGQNWSGSILDTGVAIYEHDLVVNIISSEVENPADMRRYSIDLVFLKFSTGEYHPLAHHPLLHVQRSTLGQPYTIVKIMGDNLALLVHNQEGSKLFIFDWKTGHKRLEHKAIEDAYDYSIPVFLSPELLLVPNSIQSHFEIWHLFPSPNTNTPVQILSLEIPAVSINYSIVRFDCHGQLSPVLHSMPYFPPRPFYSSDSIITVTIRFESLQGLRSVYKLIVHRSTLLDMIQSWTAPSLLEQQQGLPRWLTNEVAVHKVSDPDNGLVRLSAQSELVSTMRHSGSSRTHDSRVLATSQISPTSPASHVSADSSSSTISSGSTSSTSRYNILQVQWVDWGPPISRWFHLNGTQTWRITQTTGQRWVFLDANPRDRKKCKVGVADFNPYNIRRNAETMALLRGGEGVDSSSNGNNGEGEKEEIEEELEILDHRGVFSEEVYMGLKYVVYYAQGEYDFDAVLVDEGRLLGLKIDGEDRVESIQVLYFG